MANEEPGERGTMTREAFLRWLRRMHACREAVQWALEHADATPQRIWETAPDGEWLFWLADQAGVSFPIRHLARPHNRDASASARRAYADEVRSVLPWEQVEDALMERGGAATEREALVRKHVELVRRWSETGKWSEREAS